MPETKRLALIGANGMLAGMIRRLAPPGCEILPFDLPGFDLTYRDQVRRVLEAARPQVIVNCAAYTNVDGCESQEDLATRVNGDGPGHLAEAAGKAGATLVHISTDYVFAGRSERPYAETDPPEPLSAYGRSKLRGEEAILTSGLERFFIIRTSWLYGPGGKNFVETIARLAGEREELRIVADQIGSPTFTGDLAQAIFNLLKLDTPHSSTLTPHNPYGIYHFANEGQCSWHGFAEAIVQRLDDGKVRARRILPICTDDYPLPAPRPAYSVLCKDKYRQATRRAVPEWRDGLERYLGLRSPNNMHPNEWKG